MGYSVQRGVTACEAVMGKGGALPALMRGWMARILAICRSMTVSPRARLAGRSSGPAPDIETKGRWSGGVVRCCTSVLDQFLGFFNPPHINHKDFVTNGKIFMGDPGLGSRDPKWQMAAKRKVMEMVGVVRCLHSLGGQFLALFRPPRTNHKYFVATGRTFSENQGLLSRNPKWQMAMIRMAGTDSAVPRAAPKCSGPCDCARPQTPLPLSSCTIPSPFPTKRNHYGKNPGA